MKKRDTYSEQELKAMVHRALSRRQFLGRTALAAGGLTLGSAFLNACKGKEGGEQAAAAAKTVRISNWPLYIDQKTVADFEAATGITAVYTEDVNDNNEFFSKLQPTLQNRDPAGRSIFVVTDWMANKMHNLGYLQMFDQKSVAPEATRQLASIEIIPTRAPPGRNIGTASRCVASRFFINRRVPWLPWFGSLGRSAALSGAVSGVTLASPTSTLTAPSEDSTTFQAVVEGRTTLLASTVAFGSRGCTTSPW